MTRTGPEWLTEAEVQDRSKLTYEQAERLQRYFRHLNSCDQCNSAWDAEGEGAFDRLRCSVSYQLEREGYRR
jgi:hypothetical protein